ncbi:MAG TPA: hypothetical protein VIP70_00615, partial [Nitrososphaeraceae archaeon]
MDDSSPQTKDDITNNISSSSSHPLLPSKPNNLLTEGILAGQRIAKISVVTLISIGIAELITGYISGSVVATADGIDS